ncbi:hypothetical protein [Lagierella massiliensis]|uniref:hypothetical protein n=1 Tax=Lagierella massiliensis TaxID=1689303 RepID=UPI0006D7B848|nr:hypothetical protein [Lagierella massiliensis]
MKRDEIYKKMGFWNNFYLVISVISALIGIKNVIDTFITKSYVKQLEQLRDLGINPEDFEPTIFDKVILVLTVVIGIFCVVVAFKNRNRIIDKVKVDILPYALTLILSAYGFINGITSSLGKTGATSNMNEEITKSMENVPKSAIAAGIGIVVVIAVIVLLIELLPSIRMLVLNSKLKKLPEEEEVYE